jgi:hypothetical protein
VIDVLDRDVTDVKPLEKRTCSCSTVIDVLDRDVTDVTVGSGISKRQHTEPLSRETLAASVPEHTIENPSEPQTVSAQSHAGCNVLLVVFPVEDQITFLDIDRAPTGVEPVVR